MILWGSFAPTSWPTSDVGDGARRGVPRSARSSVLRLRRRFRKDIVELSWCVLWEGRERRRFLGSTGTFWGWDAVPHVTHRYETELYQIRAWAAGVAWLATRYCRHQPQRSVHLARYRVPQGSPESEVSRLITTTTIAFILLPSPIAYSGAFSSLQDFSSKSSRLL